MECKHIIFIVAFVVHYQRYKYIICAINKYPTVASWVGALCVPMGAIYIPTGSPPPPTAPRDRPHSLSYNGENIQIIQPTEYQSLSITFRNVHCDKIFRLLKTLRRLGVEHSQLGPISFHNSKARFVNHFKRSSAVSLTLSYSSNYDDISLARARAIQKSSFTSIDQTSTVSCYTDQFNRLKARAIKN